MQKTTIALILFLLVTSYAQSQSRYLGIKAGLNIPNLSGDQSHELSKDYKSRLASSFGLFFEFRRLGHLSFQIELNYSGQGGIRKGIQPLPANALKGFADQGITLPDGVYIYADFENEVIINCLEVPLLGKFYFGSKNRFYVDFGPYIGYVLNARANTVGTSTFYLDSDGNTPLTIPNPFGGDPFPIPPVTLDAEPDIKAELNNINYGLTGGLGVNIPILKNSYIFADARASYAITKTQKNPTKNGSTHIGNILISLGYAVKI